ncbi:hypothetical protein ACFL2H_02755, partial [Planctomycetota bacterium]
NERNRPINKGIAWSILIGSIVVTVTATAFYRVYSIPTTDGEALKLVQKHDGSQAMTEAQDAAFQQFEAAAAETTSLPSNLDGRFFFEHIQSLEKPEDEGGGHWIDTNNDSIVDAYQAVFDPSPVRDDWTHSWSNIKTMSSEEQSWLAENASVLPSIVEAIRNPEFTSGPDPGQMWSRHSIRLLVARARSRTDAGELETALEDYKTALKLTGNLADPIHQVHQWIGLSQMEQMVLENLVGWAGHPDQSKESIAELMEWLATRNETPPSPANAMAAGYLRYRNVFSDTDAIGLMVEARDVERTTLIYRFMPWERVRSKKLYDYVNVQQQKWVKGEIGKLRGGGPIIPSNMSRTSPLMANQQALVTTLVTHWLLSPDESLVKLAIDLENQRRAITWQLGLIAHRIEHGTYPESLDEVETLVEFRDTDLLTGLPFQYVTSDTQPVFVNEPLGTYCIVADTPQLLSPNQYWYGSAGQWRNKRYWLP